jgi:hypothetical protein
MDKPKSLISLHLISQPKMAPDKAHEGKSVRFIRAPSTRQDMTKRRERPNSIARNFRDRQNWR